MIYRDSASYGKRQEYIAVSELLKRNFDVYMTLIDDQGIDCVVRVNHTRYLDIQIKTRSKNAIPRDWAYFPRLNVPEGRDNYFFLFFSEGANCYWTFPANDIISLAASAGTNVSRNLTGANAGKYAIRTAGHSSGCCIPFERFDKYKNDYGFALLK
ncbi:hypothetical protein [Paenibacillus zanthoxyli]|uniref:hypothetical protein n=1 Tax=Paenibacillus zanthoxyli TaxID=369399 RepID=UPI00046EDCA1|nr:hypothetical protein [Paenibacillus zanthoxyli]